MPQTHPHPRQAFIGDNVVSIHSDVIDIVSVTDWATIPSCGAVVAFAGTVRENSAERQRVTSITYEAYERYARKKLYEVIDGARARWPDLGRVAIIHRIGSVSVTESSVLVVVSSAHRHAAFVAARFCIDVLKRTVPVWKLECAVEDSDWVRTGTEIATVEEVGRQWDSANLQGDGDSWRS